MKIIILTTPFHLQQIIRLRNTLNLSREHVCVLYSDYVNETEILEKLGKPVDLFPFYSSSLQLSYKPYFKRIAELMLNPFKYVVEYRNLVKSNFDFLGDIFSRMNLERTIELIIFNDRDFLSQIAIELLKTKSRSYSVTAIDEGTGFYIKETLMDKVLKLGYRLLSKPLLGFNYHYMEQYGTHPSISKVFIRYPDLLPRKLDYIQYYKIEEELEHEKIDLQLDRPSILLFSTLLSEEGFSSESEEIDFYRTLSVFAVQRGYGLVIKHHPRERKEKLDKVAATLLENGLLEFRIVDRAIHGEQINTTSFNWVINFGSSIVLNILNTGFPADKILTIRLKNVPFCKAIFSATRIVPFRSFFKNLNSVILPVRANGSASVSLLK